ncbi:phosphoribosylanthranilate isomerase [Rubellimicrobium roseum]|uniref:N-(5'-phosphoribosyl)anthranilate isomerase n=1 Tax=Rubellimicrobium roseum TaxID=687525 RepID=A0A5C4NEB1_9RHOB|nr:phosphoribosylanthranilate isomerase [Rubellimicrobium roseum]TNC69840.1 phosphoribosylanthranilate isomerase [Rubellimicrobium roseum]
MAFRVTGPEAAGSRAAGRAGGPVRVKVCGLTTPAQVESAAEAGAGYVGLVFFPPSPRALGIDAAREIAWAAPVGLAKVGLFVDATDEELEAVIDRVPLDMVQLHGRETPERVREVRERWGLPVMKAVGIAGPEDVERARGYEGAADQLLLDAKAPARAPLPGGNGVAFDWGLVAGARWGVPWMLAGGLRPDNVAQALAASGARQVDVSSGVESAPGVKDAGLVRAFVKAAGSGHS